MLVVQSVLLDDIPEVSKTCVSSSGALRLAGKRGVKRHPCTKPGAMYTRLWEQWEEEGQSLTLLGRRVGLERDSLKRKAVEVCLEGCRGSSRVDHGGRASFQADG